MIIKFTDNEIKNMDKMKEEDYPGMLIGKNDTGKQLGLTFTIVDPIKAECFLMNLLSDDLVSPDDIGIKFDTINLEAIPSKNEIRQALIEIINKYLD